MKYGRWKYIRTANCISCIEKDTKKLEIYHGYFRLMVLLYDVNVFGKTNSKINDNFKMVEKSTGDRKKARKHRPQWREYGKGT